MNTLFILVLRPVGRLLQVCAAKLTITPVSSTSVGSPERVFCAFMTPTLTLVQAYTVLVLYSPDLIVSRPSEKTYRTARKPSARLPLPSVRDAASVDLSVIVPAYKENGNIRPLITRIFNALRQYDSPVPAEQVEVIIVDDNSRDGSVETVQGLQQEGYNVRIIVRTTERGLSSAVVRGFQEALGDNMLCMDADLQVGFIHWLTVAY